MDRRKLTYIALLLTMLFGVTMPLFRTVRGYPAIGAVIVALAWIAVGVFGRGEDGRDRDRVRDRG